MSPSLLTQPALLEEARTLYRELINVCQQHASESYRRALLKIATELNEQFQMGETAHIPKGDS